MRRCTANNALRNDGRESGGFFIGVDVDMRHIQYQGETLPPGISVSPGISQVSYLVKLLRYTLIKCGRYNAVKGKGGGKGGRTSVNTTRA